MRSFIVAIMACVVLVCASSLGGSMGEDRGDTASVSLRDPTDWSAAKRRKRQHRSSATRSHGRHRGQIYCPRGGCRPVPPGCGAVAERDFDDNPTGFEIIVCPPR